MAYLLVILCILSTNNQAFGQKKWTLRECISYAAENNINIKQQELNVESQKNTLNTAKSSRLPGISASANQNFNFGRGLTIDNTYANRNTQSTSFGIGADLPLYTGGQINHTIKARKLDHQTAIADLQYAKDNISIQVVSAYLEVLFQKDLLKVSADQIELSKMQEKRIQTLFDNGKCAEIDLAEIKASVANDQLSYVQQENNYHLALLTLTQLLEYPTPDSFDVATPSTDDYNINIILPEPNKVYAEATMVKPQIEAQTLRLKSAEENIRIARSGYYPNISLSAGISTNYYKTSGFYAAPFSDQMRDNLNKSFSLSLSIPIFNRFNTRNSIRSAKLQHNTQLLQLEETRKTLYKEIQQAYYNAIAAQKQCKSSMTAEDASKSSFILMTAKFVNGKATATEYQEAKTALLKATSNRIQAQYTFIFRQKILDFYRGVEL